MNNIFIEPARHSWRELTKRPQDGILNSEKLVSEILTDVKQHGDAALKKYSLKFDGFTPENFLVTNEEIDSAEDFIPGDLKEAILLAQKNIKKFHTAQVEKKVKKIETSEGVTCWRKSVPIQNAGLYVPGGTAPLFSTLLMLAIPAQLAGCKNIIVCTPPGANGKINAAILFVAKILGLKNLYKTGGAQAIAAMAYGTESIQKTDKIFGPGNNFVTLAKKLVSFENTAIDMLAGSSELVVYADDTAVPAFVASDLLSQAEHGIDSQVVLVAENIGIIEKVAIELSNQLKSLSRIKIINQSLLHSRFVLLNDIQTAFDFINFYAPEHLIIASKNAKKLSSFVINAGSVFLGNYSSESAGDYASGPNHSLPTSGTAKTYSGVSVDSFVKKITFQKISKKGIRNIGPAVETMAAAEGLDAHKNAVSIRLKKAAQEEGLKKTEDENI
ncbi:MAG: histidinol dehydrogenase [Bacteroidota bacterium]|nr:histidinol dehydrogenase [Bacteroidota bacterium]